MIVVIIILVLYLSNKIKCKIQCAMDEANGRAVCRQNCDEISWFSMSPGCTN